MRFDSNDGSIKLKIGSRIQNDYAYFAEDGDIERRLGEGFDDGTEFRRARFYFSGTIYDDIDFKVQYDFAGGDADFKDVYLGMKNMPHVGHIRVGQFKEPFSLEELTSSNYIHGAEPRQHVRAGSEHGRHVLRYRVGQANDLGGRLFSEDGQLRRRQGRSRLQRDGAAVR